MTYTASRRIDDVGRKIEKLESKVENLERCLAALIKEARDPARNGKGPTIDDLFDARPLRRRPR